MNERQAIKALKEAGFVEKRHAGSHKRFEHRKYNDLAVPVPCHGGRDLKPWEEASIRGAIRDAKKRKEEES